MAEARLVLVHGRAQEGKSEAELIKEWMTPLRAALGTRAHVLDGVEVIAPFYGDRLIELVRSVGEALPDDIIVRGGADVEAGYRAFLGDQLEAIRQMEGISDEQIAAEAGLDVMKRGPQNWPWVVAIIRTLNGIPGIDGDMIERFLRDVWIYLERRSIRDIIDAMVKPAFDTDLPVICIAHSLGSVVTYNILSSSSSGRIPLLVTIGSPLGLAISRRALAPITHPSMVDRWFNARDARDVVALYPLTAAHFDVTPPIEDYSEVRNRTPNAHGISGYLNDAVVAEQLYEALITL